MNYSLDKHPSVSVIVPLYNKGPFVERAIRSVLNQTINEFEIIVVEGGSSDNSLEVVQAFTDPRLSIIQQVEKGVSAARNEGVQIAKSDFLAFLDADDEWMPDFLETVLRLRHAYPEAGVYFTAIMEKCLDNSEEYQNYSFMPGKGWEGVIENYFGALLCNDPLYYPSSMALNKKIYQEYGGFPKGSSWGEDQDLCGRIALQNQVVFSSKVCSIIHKTDEYSRAMKRRVLSTGEHPFIKSALIAQKNGNIPKKFAQDLNNWTIGLILFSVRYNLIVGNPACANTILKKYSDLIPFRKKALIGVWCKMPVWTFNIKGHSLFMEFGKIKIFLKRLYKS